MPTPDFDRFLNQTFHHLTVIAYLGWKKGRSHIWKCRCSCGQELPVYQSNLVTENTKSCGCLKRLDPNAFIGKQINDLTVKRFLGYKENISWFEVECVCGKTFEIRGTMLSQRKVRSCGCLRKTRKPNQNPRPRTGVYAPYTRETHPLHKTWVCMRSRCEKPKDDSYRNYGAKGIYVCDRWKSFRNFVLDMHPKPGPEYTLDRIDGTGPYSPENCRWATHKQQALNRSNTVNIEYKGVTKPLDTWCQELDLDYRLVYSRLRQGWAVEKAFETPKTGKVVLTYKEKTLSLKEWAIRTGIPYSVLYARVKDGWDASEILATPVGQRRAAKE